MTQDTGATVSKLQVRYIIENVLAMDLLTSPVVGMTDKYFIPLHYLTKHTVVDIISLEICLDC